MQRCTNAEIMRRFHFILALFSSVSNSYSLIDPQPTTRHWTAHPPEAVATKRQELTRFSPHNPTLVAGHAWLLRWTRESFLYWSYNSPSRSSLAQLLNCIYSLISIIISLLNKTHITSAALTDIPAHLLPTSPIFSSGQVVSSDITHTRLQFFNQSEHVYPNSSSSFPPVIVTSLLVLLLGDQLNKDFSQWQTWDLPGDNKSPCRKKEHFSNSRALACYGETTGNPFSFRANSSPVHQAESQAESHTDAPCLPGNDPAQVVSFRVKSLSLIEILGKGDYLAIPPSVECEIRNEETPKIKW